MHESHKRVFKFVCTFIDVLFTSLVIFLLFYLHSFWGGRKPLLEKSMRQVFFLVYFCSENLLQMLYCFNLFL